MGSDDIYSLHFSFIGNCPGDDLFLDNAWVVPRSRCLFLKFDLTLYVAGAVESAGALRAGVVAIYWRFTSQYRVVLGRDSDLAAFLASILCPVV